MRLVCRSPWITLNFIKMINNYPTGAQFKLTREHFVSKFRRNFFSFKVTQYSPCAVLKTTTIRVNSDQLIMWFISNDGVWIFVLYHKCTATENLKMSRKEIFDHGCGRYSTTSKICKTNLKLLVKSEYFHYTQWHLWIDSLYDGSMRQRVISQLLYPFKPVS